jgi:hypothetical protein
MWNDTPHVYNSPFTAETVQVAARSKLWVCGRSPAWTIPVAAQSKLWVCGRSPAWTISVAARSKLWVCGRSPAWTISVAARYKLWVWGRSLAGVAGSNPTGGAWMSVCCECCLLSGRVLCDGLIARPENSYRLRYVVLCDLRNLVNWDGPGTLERGMWCWSKIKAPTHATFYKNFVPSNFHITATCFGAIISVHLRGSDTNTAINIVTINLHIFFCH